jgi:hypothetical protein
MKAQDFDHPRPKSGLSGLLLGTPRLGQCWRFDLNRERSHENRFAQRRSALVLTSTYSVSSFAQHDDDTYLAPPDGGDRYRMHYRGENDEQSEDRQDNGHMDRGRDRWRDMGPMMRRGSGARFQFSRGDAHIDIRCPQNESLQNCVQAAS